MKIKTVPRYTSYPTAVEFSSQIDGNQVSAWQSELTEDKTLSLYFHIPFCDQLCWFCGCHTKIINHYRPVEHYLGYLKQETSLHAERLHQNLVTHIHFGGGSPTMLSAEDFDALMRHVRSKFNLSTDAEIDIEVDPRTVSKAKISAYARNGVKRASLGLQDFDPKVQKAINRVQSYELVSHVVENFREEGINALNVDLVYGLPHQTLASFQNTLEQALTLSPDRISLFGYAHVPNVKKHQNLIETDALPDPELRLALADMSRETFLEAGYQEIGLDHFARTDDKLAIAARNGEMVRNFQGYTTDRADALIGIGISSISNLPQGYAQNTADMIAYAKALDAGELPIARGVSTSAEDITRRKIIMDLMCFLRAKVDAARFTEAEPELRPYLDARDAEYDGQTLHIAYAARQKSRLIASCFDQYLQANETRFSQAI